MGWFVGRGSCCGHWFGLFLYNNAFQGFLGIFLGSWPGRLRCSLGFGGFTRARDWRWAVEAVRSSSNSSKSALDEVTMAKEGPHCLNCLTSSPSSSLR